MKKILLLSIIAILIASSLSALDFKVGPKVTLGDYSARGTDFTDENEFSLSYSGGVFVNLQLISMLGIQIEGLLSHTTTRSNDGTGWMQINMNTVSFPVYARFNFDIANFGIYLLAGPRIDLFFDKMVMKTEAGISADLTLDDANSKSYQIGAGVGVGAMLPIGPGALDLGVGFNTALTKVDKDNTRETYPYAIEAQVAYGFGF